jgi:uncharacterized protein
VSAANRVDVVLVAGGRWHDVDYARAEILGELVRHDVTRTRVFEAFVDPDVLDTADVLVTWTCDVRPDPEQATALVRFVSRGGRWLALHASTSVIDPPDRPGAVYRTPRVLGEVAQVLGSQFIAHPPIAPFRVDVANSDHPLVRGIDSFETTDELYVSEVHPPFELLLSAHYAGACRGFEEGAEVDGDWPVLTMKATGAGSVCVFTLGHCRGRFDLADVGVEDRETVDHIAWQTPQYRELLRRTIAWAVHGDGWSTCLKTGAAA